MVEQDRAYLANREANKAVEGTVTEAAKNQENKSLSYFTAGDAKKGAGLFKVRPSLFDHELSSLLADQMCAMPYHRRIRGQQDWTQSTRALWPQDRSSPRIFVHGCKQTEGYHMGRRLSGKGSDVKQAQKGTDFAV